jgi:predicted small metal-binding protein
MEYTEENMAKVLRCKHIGPDSNCQFEARGKTNEEILGQVAKHAKEVHGIDEVSDDLVQKALANIREEG